jgi:4-hydroxybenzoate polyprenyltransferase
MPVPVDSSSISSAVRAERFTVSAFIEALRPAQWLKNGFVFAALIFSRRLTVWWAVVLAGLAAFIFCEISSAAYLMNDVLDAAEDREHPVKRLRPVASGRLEARIAMFASVVLGLSALGAAWVLDHAFFAVVAAYAGTTVLYSTLLKHVPLLDVFVIAGGFVLRVLGGAVAIHVEVSSWLIVCTTLLALFVALAKRRHELVLLGDEAPSHRPHLSQYSPYFLDQLIAVVTASTLMSYALYTLSSDAQTKFPGKRLELTIPFVLFGIFRYLYLIHQSKQGGSPTRLLLTDSVLLATVVLWGVSAILIIYS